MFVRTSVRVAALYLAAVCCTTQLLAQSGVPLAGRLLNSLTGEPIAGATVTIDELRRETTSAADGRFTFDNVPPGTYHLSVRGSGYSSRRTEVTAAAGAPARRRSRSIPSCTSRKWSR